MYRDRWVGKKWVGTALHGAITVGAKALSQEPGIQRQQWQEAIGLGRSSRGHCEYTEVV